jgi:MoaA/NifB/PqqE/SkfB family radical SAM enzyme
MRASSKARAALAVLRAHLTGAKTPLSAVLMSNDSCNLKCRYCAIWRRERRQMTTQEVLGVVDDLADMGCVRLSIFGGEPLLRKDIGLVVSHARARGLHVGLGSNGVLVPSRVHELRGLDILHISIDGPREAHDRVRGKGSFDAAVRAIEAARSEGITVWTMTVLTRHNLDVVDEVLDLADRYGMVAYFHPVSARADSGDHVRELLPEPEALRRTLGLILRRKREGRRVGNSPAALEYFMGFPRPSRDIACWAGRLFCHIDANGDVFGCLENKDKSPPNSLLEKGFRRAFEEIRCASCNGCWSYSTSDFNLLFSLDPRVVWNTLKLTR